MFLLQRLLWLLALIGAIWVLRRLLSGGTRRQTSPGRRSVPERGEGDMVRDQICNTFLPRTRALTLSDQTGEHFFCSERCRKIHLARKAG